MSELVFFPLATAVTAVIALLWVLYGPKRKHPFETPSIWGASEEIAARHGYYDPRDPSLADPGTALCEPCRRPRRRRPHRCEGVLCNCGCREEDSACN